MARPDEDLISAQHFQPKARLVHSRLSARGLGTQSGLIVSQLRSDLTRAFKAAAARVQGFSAGDGDLREGVHRSIGAPMRFVDPNPDIQDAQAHMAERIDALQELLGSPDGASQRLQDQTRREAYEAVEALKLAILEHGCASAAADRVGLGVQGKRI